MQQIVSMLFDRFFAVKKNTTSLETTSSKNHEGPKKQRKYLTIFRVGFCRHWISSFTKYLLRLFVGISGLPVIGPKFPNTKSAVIGGETILNFDLFTRRLGVFLVAT